MTPHALPSARGVLEAGVAAGLHPGAQLHVSLDHRIRVDLAVGDARPGVPMTADSLLVWASSTKPITALALGQLWERGLLELDDPISRHLTEFGQGRKESITIRHALTHTGGFRHLSLGWPDRSWDEIVARICAARLEPRWTPGEKAGYHLASSWFVLAEVVRRCDGRPFERYVREEIFEPLGMDDCWIGMPDERYDGYGDRIAVTSDTERPGAPAHTWHEADRLTRPNPGGNGCGPARQLARFYAMLLGRGSLDGARLVSPQTVEALVSRHRVGLWDHTFKARLDWGLGFIPSSAHYGDEGLPYQYGRHASRRVFGHSGYRSSTAFADPEHGLVVVALVNGTPSESAHRKRFETLCNAVYEDLGLAARRE